MRTRTDPTKARLRRENATSIGYEVIGVFQVIILAVGHAFLKILRKRMR
jgi:hypothetical protein